MSTNRILIIAEAGVNHNGDIEMAKRLIEVAGDAGADLVKFQTFSADRLVTAEAQKADYQNKTTTASETQHAMLKRLELSSEMHETLIKHCHQMGVSFFSSGFDIPSVRFLDELGMEQIKIPSGEITNLPYLRYVGGLRKTVFLSTGMATMGEIEEAIAALESTGTPRKNITVLHCNTEYPTPMVDVNLRAMASISQAFEVPVGYSDHTAGFEVAIAAVALGATVIEKHFTLDRNLPGPDHMASLEPDELKLMVSAIRNIEQAMGDGIKCPSPSESKNISIARKSIVAAKDIKAGDIFTDDNLIAKRPGTGISPMRWDDVIGGKASRNYARDELIVL